VKTKYHRPFSSSYLLSPLVLLTASVAIAQVAPAPSVSPATLAKYDKNKNGSLESDELAAMQATEGKAASAVATTASSSEEGNVIQLSPFEVDGTGDRGYRAGGTMAGTRLNSRLEDLAASLSVVTKQQLEDTAALDINDIFLYEVGTEGTGQYTDLTNDGRGDYDNIAGNPTGANRMRGLSQAGISVGGFTASSTIPIDTYNVAAVEIARGPNSSLAGLSEGGGTVNLVTTAANLRRESTQVSGRVDSYGGFRATFDVNRPLWRDKAAIRFSAVYNEIGYIRKPSVERNNRQQLALSLRPFQGTTINASVERFSQFAQRANSLTPRDTVAQWKALGSPTYDPITRTYQVNGVRSAPITNINQLPAGITGIGGSNVRIQQYIDGDTIAYMQRGLAPTNTIVGTNAQTQVVQSSGINVAGGPLYKVPGSTNKAFYDWEEINLAASGYATGRATLINASIDQRLLQTSRNRSDVQVAWRREDQEDYRRQFIGQQDGVGTTVVIDATERFLDGSPNPFVGRPFIGGNQPQAFRRPVFTDSYRAQVAHQLDLRKEQNFTKWLGLQRFIGYYEHNKNISVGNGYRYTDIVYDISPLNPAAANRIGNGARFFPRFYMGDAVGGNIDYANSGPKAVHGRFNVRYLEATSPAWRDESVVIDEVYFSQEAQKRKINTAGGSVQSFWLKDMLVTTFGEREDRVYTIRPLAIPMLPNGFFDEAKLDDLNNYGREKKWRRGETSTKGGVFRPFREWKYLQRERTGVAKYAAEALRGLSFHYNESNSFRPADVAYNVFLTELPNPEAKSEEYGFSLSMFDNRLWMRLTHQETLQVNKRGGTGVLGSRAVSIDFDIPGQTRNFDLYGDLTTWAMQANPTWTLEQAQADALKKMSITPEQIAAYSGKTIDDSTNSLSKGWELELQFNPNQYWTIKATGNKQLAIDSGVSVHIQDYINSRLPVWTTIRNPAGDLWWTANDGGDVPSDYYFNLVRTPLDLAITTQGKKKPQVREYSFNVLTNYRLAGIAGDRKWLRGLEVGGAYRWASKGAVGYLAGKPDVDGVVRSLDGNKPFYDKPVGNLDLSMSYRTKLFNNRIAARFQLNVRNVTESGSLRGVAVNPDGQFWQYRIIDPRQFIFTTTFDL
jgi:outer membrane receptor protein involved in Fe transport